MRGLCCTRLNLKQINCVAVIIESAFSRFNGEFYGTFSGYLGEQKKVFDGY